MREEQLERTRESTPCDLKQTLNTQGTGAAETWRGPAQLYIGASRVATGAFGGPEAIGTKTFEESSYRLRHGRKEKISNR